jgi:tetratricopeptide (TPR) repeat protein
VSRRDQDQDDDGFGEASRYTAHLDRGWSLLDRGDFQHARNSARQALELRPELPDAAMLLAAISLTEGDPETSLEWYERAIETDAEYVDAQLAVAQVLLYDLEQPERALARAGLGRELEEATLADLLDFGLIEAEALVSLGDHDAAAERLHQLTELWVIEDLLDTATQREQLPDLLRQFAGHGDEWATEPDMDIAGPPAELSQAGALEAANQADFEPDELEHLMGRVVSLAVRVARLHMELGTPELALPWLDGLLRRFGDDPDIWYLANEAAFLAGQPVRAAHAALQVLQLDARVAMPEPSMQPAEIHAKVVELLLACPDPELRVLAREPSFVVVVNEAPPFELVLEGVDPRARVLALAARTGRDEEVTPTLTGLAIYRRNLASSARAVSSAHSISHGLGPARPARGNAGQAVDDATEASEDPVFERELALAVFDELSVFFGFDETRRDRLGLPSNEWRPAPRATEVASQIGGQISGQTSGQAGQAVGANTSSPAVTPDAPVRAAKKKKTSAKPKRKSKPSEAAASKPAKVDKSSKPKSDAKPGPTRKRSDEAED